MTGETGDASAPGGPPGTRPRRLLVGIGAPDRGDDAVGPAVVALISEWMLGSQLGVTDTSGHQMALPAGTRVLTRTDPSRLVEEMADADLVVIVDAVRAGGPVGTVHVLVTGAGQPPIPASATAAAGSHGFGVEHALALARALGTLPAQVVLIGVEGLRFDLGAPMSPGVRDSLVAAARAALEALGHDAPFDVTELPAGLPHPSAIVPPPIPRAPG